MRGELSTLQSAHIREKVGNVSIMPKGASEAKTAAELITLVESRLLDEAARIQAGLDGSETSRMIKQEFERLSAAVSNDDPIWRADLPGRVILHKFASAAGIQNGRLKQLYLGEANTNEAFADIVDIFQYFQRIA